jgi:RNA polymerase sigma-70 factor (ECF subfamily)
VADSADVVDLVRAAQAGDREAFAHLYERYVGMVYAIGVARLPPEEARDVVQEVFLRALRTLKRLRDPRAFGGWLAAIARHAAVDASRARNASGATSDEASSADNPHRDLVARIALQAIRSLPVAYRETLLMRLLQGMTGPEIAERTGLTPASVRVNLHRGMKLLRRRFMAGKRASNV